MVAAVSKPKTTSAQSPSTPRSTTTSTTPGTQPKQTQQSSPLSNTERSQQVDRQRADPIRRQESRAVARGREQQEQERVQQKQSEQVQSVRSSTNTQEKLDYGSLFKQSDGYSDGAKGAQKKLQTAIAGGDRGAIDFMSKNAATGGKDSSRAADFLSHGGEHLNDRDRRAMARGAMTGSSYSDGAKATRKAIKDDKGGALDGVRDMLKTDHAGFEDARRNAARTMADNGDKLEAQDVKTLETAATRDKSVAPDATKALVQAEDRGVKGAGKAIDGVVDKYKSGTDYDSQSVRENARMPLTGGSDKAKAAGFDPVVGEDIRGLTSSNPEVRARAMSNVEAEAVKGNPQAVAELKSVTADFNRTIGMSEGREEARKSAGASIAKAQEHLSKSDWQDMSKEVGSIGNAYVGPAFESALKAGNDDAMDVLNARVTGANAASDRESAANLLGHAGENLRDKDFKALTNGTHAAFSAITAGVDRGNTAANDALREGLKHKDSNVRARSADAMGNAKADKLGAKDFNALRDAGLKDSDHSVRRSAAEGLEGLLRGDNVPQAAIEAGHDFVNRGSSSTNVNTQNAARGMGHAVDRAEHNNKPAKDQALIEAKRGWGSGNLGQRLADEMPNMSASERREAIDAVKGWAKSDPTATAQTLGKMAPYLNADDVKALDDIKFKSSGKNDVGRDGVPPGGPKNMSDSRRRDGEKEWAEQTRFERTVQDAYTSVMENGGDPKARDAAATSLSERKWGEMSPDVQQKAIDYANKTQNVDVKAATKRTLPHAAIPMPKDAHKKLTMNDSRAQKVLQNPDNWTSLDGNNGLRAQGEVSNRDLQRAANDERLSDDVRAAAAHYAEKGGGLTRRAITGGSRDEYHTFDKSHTYDKSGDRNDSRTFVTGAGKEVTNVQRGDGTRSYQEREFNAKRTSTKIRETDKSGRETGEFKQSTSSVDPRKDVAGVGWLHKMWGSNAPQIMRNGLGGNVHGERTHTSTSGPKGYSSTSSERMFTLGRDGQVNRELSRTQTGKGAARWQYKSKNADGTVDSQLFIEGSRDTVVTKNTKENGWNVQRTNAKLDDANRLAKEHSADQVPPKSATHVERTKDDATLRDFDDALRQTGLSSAHHQQAVKQFRETARGKKMSIATSFTSDSNGTRQGQVVATMEDGSRVVVGGNSNASASEARLNDKQAIVSVREGKQQKDIELQLNDKGKVDAFKLEGENRVKDDALSDALSTSRDIMNLTSGASNLSKYPALARTAASLGDVVPSAKVAQKTADFAESMRRAEKVIDGALPHLPGALGALDAVQSVNSALNVTRALADGDMEKAARHAAKLGLDSGSAIMGLSEYAIARGANAQSLAGAMRMGRFLGSAGAVATFGFGVNDFMNGDKIGGSISMANGIGVGMAVAGGTWQSVGWMGPVGWGIAGVATAAGLVYDSYKHIDATGIADLEIAR